MRKHLSENTTYFYFLVSSCFLVLSILLIEFEFPALYRQFETTFIVIEYSILGLFTIDFLYKLITYTDKAKYVFSFWGLIDLLSILPSYISLMLGLGPSFAWLRILKIIQLMKVLNLFNAIPSLGGIVGKTLPLVVVGASFKIVIIILETTGYWFTFVGFTTLFSVMGFCLAVLLGTKLNVVNTRIYSIEDCVCRIVGALREMPKDEHLVPIFNSWSKDLEITLKSSQEDKPVKVKEMRIRTTELSDILRINKVSGPNTAGFHRDVAYLLHRVTARTPSSYEKFLRYIILTYVILFMIGIPGFTGLISTILIISTLSGMYFLIDDMDDPLSYDQDSYIDVRLDALEQWNEKA